MKGGVYMNHTIKMIVSDLDGTLLMPDKTISAYTKNILNRCRALGIKIVYATGRGGSAKWVAAPELFDGRITMNGAFATVDNTAYTTAKDLIFGDTEYTAAKDLVLYECLIPYKTARSMLIACDEHGIKITSEINGMHYSNFVVSDFWPGITNFEIVDFSRHELDAEKVYSPNLSREEQIFIEKQMPDDLYSVVTSDITGDLLQIMHINATKAIAVSKLAHLWGIAPSEIVAFGDERNDINMLSYAGIGVATDNALDEVKAISNFICKNNAEDGPAKWIEENIL